MPKTPPSRVVLSGHSVEEIVPLVQSHGFTLVESDPELIICHGGDGTLIGAEREWPGVPKVSIQRSDVCKACPRHTPEAILRTLAAGEFISTEHMKIRGEARGETLVGINEVLIHNAQVTSAVRYVVDIDGVPLGHEIIGDGLVVATPFGSSAYFRSITNSTFLVGIGLAFNNSTEPIDHLVLSPDDVIRVLITRGPALLASDNNPQHIPLDRGDDVLIQRHPEPAVILMPETLTCPHCRRIREVEGSHKHIHMRPDHRGALTNSK